MESRDPRRHASLRKRSGPDKWKVHPRYGPTWAQAPGDGLRLQDQSSPVGCCRLTALGREGVERAGAQVVDDITDPVGLRALAQRIT